jgi:hypothetical protein
VDLGCQRGEQTPWAKRLSSCRPLLQVADGPWTCLEVQGGELTNNDPVGVRLAAVVRASRKSVIQFRIRDWSGNRDWLGNMVWLGNCRGDQSGGGAICLSPLLTVTTTIRPKGQYGWRFLEQAWISHHCGGAMPAWLPDPSYCSAQPTRS